MKNNSLSSFFYDNKFEWKNVFRVLGFALGLAIIIVLIFIFGDLVFEGKDSFFFTHHELNPYAFWPIFFVFLIPLIGIVISYLIIVSTGEYCISGDNLIVHEHFISETNISIPIASISNVRYTPYFTHREKWYRKNFFPSFCPFQFIEITVNGQKYVLHCVAHANELHDELLKRIQ